VGYFCKIESKGIDHILQSNVFLVLYVCFVDRCLSVCTLSFGHCVVCSSSIYDSDYPFGIFKLFFLFTWRKVHISLPKDTTHRMTTVLLQVSLYNEHVLIYLSSGVIFVGQLVIL
jgi:hypothetical protein